MMCGTQASVSTLLITVGLANAPAIAGNGGLLRGQPRLPSRASSRPVFLAADVSAGAFVDVALELVLAAEDSLGAEDFIVVGFLDRALEDFGLPVIFAADEDVGDVASRGDGCDRDSFEHLMGVVIHQVAIFESAGLGFVGVDAEIMRAALFFGDEGPLLACREARPTATAQAAVNCGFDDVGGLHLQRGFEAFVAAAGDVVVVPEGLALGGVLGNAFEEDGFLEGHKNQWAVGSRQ